MAFHSVDAAQSNMVAVSVRWGGKQRALKLNPWIGGLLLGVLPLLATWYLCATVYVVFHDQLLASLMSRQSDMQYAYEDRIAALKTQLDRETSRGLVDRHTLETTVRDLSERGNRLEARAATIDALVSDGLGRQPAHGEARSRTIAPGVSDNPLLAPAGASGLPPDVRAYDGGPDRSAAPSIPGLRLDGSVDTSSLQTTDPGHDVEARADDIAKTLDAVEARQTKVVGRLRDPAIRAVQRMQTALALTGLPLARHQQQADVGGPFVPLDGDSSTFGQSVELARDAVAEFGRLSEIVDRVPLRRPLDGPLEVTSTFGARLDPFFGRPAMHTGIDLRENYGDKVEATAAGIVTIAGSEGGYGNMVEIDHGNGLATRYAHLSSIGVVVHQRIAAGDIVGRVGSTGRATGPHLHYETRINGEAVDPSRFLKAGSGLFPG